MNRDPLFEPLALRSWSDALQPEEGGSTYWREVRRQFFKHRLAVAALVLLGLLIIFAALGPTISGYTHYEIHLEQHNQPPSRTFWFGSDDLGRDIFTRVAYGARISLFVSFVAALIDVTIGIVYGGLAGYLSGRVDSLLMRFADVLHAIPYLLIVILLTVVMGPGLLTIIAALSLTGWIGMARMVRGQVIQLRERPFVQAAIALGASPKRVVVRHIIPNALGPIIVMMTFTIPTAVFTEAFLSFLGLGVQAPVASWGTMASDALSSMRYYPWRLFFPASFISLTMLVLYTIGDALRDAIDPRLR